MFVQTPTRLDEIAQIKVEEVDLKEWIILVHGKGRGCGKKDRYVRYGPKAADALARYVIARRKHRDTALPQLWLRLRGPMTKSGVYQMVSDRSRLAGVAHVWPHRYRPTYAHEWKASGGSDEDLMSLGGWQTTTMMIYYGSSLAAERALMAADPIQVGESI
jgi:integrase